MRIAHFSDLHLLDLEGAVPGRLFNKRLTGYANLKLRRGHKHKPAPVDAAAYALRELSIDHVVVTGDLSNLALEREFDRVLAWLTERVGMSPADVSLVPGNHDAYTRGAVRSGRFHQWFSEYLTSDLPEVAEGAAFPFIRLRGPVAFIGLSTAVSRPPLVASGNLGAAQLAALSRALAHPEVASRVPVLLQHHPIHNPHGFAKTALEGLWDAAAEVRALRDVARGLVLHGHLHRRVHRTLTTRGGVVDAVGSTSASLLSADPDRMAGFNVYEITEDRRISSIQAHRFDPETSLFVDAPVPKLR